MSLVIITYQSKTGSTKITHTIHGESKSGSYSDYIRLKNDYRSKDIDYMLEDMSWKVRLFHHWNFLIRRMMECGGNLMCVYCGKQNLIIQAVNVFVTKEKMATVDHFIPKDKGGEHLDEDNMVVCCSKCNSKKKNNIWSVDTLVYMDSKRKKIFINKYSTVNNI